MSKIEEYNANPNQCRHCGQPIFHRGAVTLYNTKNKKFCSRSCVILHNVGKVEEYNANPNYCLHCNSPILHQNQKISLSNTKSKKFCDSSCAGTYNGKKFPKRTNHLPCITEKVCESCNINKFTRKKGSIRRLCDECLKMSRLQGRPAISSRAKGYLFETASCWQSARNTIRMHAKQVYKDNNKPFYCAACGYDLFVEICHIKSVSSFPMDATIAEINNISNLIALCPTHHWELDNGYLAIDQK